MAKAIITTPEAAKLTLRVTAFSSLGQMQKAMSDGYVPTLRRDKPEQLKLGRYLEHHGRRVFWSI